MTNFAWLDDPIEGAEPSPQSHHGIYIAESYASSQSVYHISGESESYILDRTPGQGCEVTFFPLIEVTKSVDGTFEHHLVVSSPFDSLGNKKRAPWKEIFCQEMHMEDSKYEEIKQNLHSNDMNVAMSAVIQWSRHVASAAKQVFNKLGGKFDDPACEGWEDAQYMETFSQIDSMKLSFGTLDQIRTVVERLDDEVVLATKPVVVLRLDDTESSVEAMVEYRCAAVSGAGCADKLLLPARWKALSYHPAAISGALGEVFRQTLTQCQKILEVPDVECSVRSEGEWLGGQAESQ